MFVVLFSSDQLGSAGISDLYNFHKDFGEVILYSILMWLFFMMFTKNREKPFAWRKTLRRQSYKDLAQRHTGTDSQDNFLDRVRSRLKQQTEDTEAWHREFNLGLFLVMGHQEEVLWFLSLMQLWWVIGDWVYYECIWTDCTGSFTRQCRQVFVLLSIFSVDKSNKCP